VYRLTHSPVFRAQAINDIILGMVQLIFTYPDDLADSVRLTPDELGAQLRLMAALKMFELGKLSSGKAAELAGVSRGEFFDACARYRVAVFNYPPETIEDELRADIVAARDGPA
jgi:predicted HTH domain antitoxin